MSLYPVLLLLFVPPPETSPVADLDSRLKSFMQAFAAIESEAADPVSPAQALYEGAIPGMLRQLDPHSVFFDPNQFEQLQQMEKSERKGFGSIVSVLPGRVIVLQAMAGTPSQKAGLSPGDEIMAINGIPLARLEFEQLVELLTVARQHEAKLDVRRTGSVRTLRFTLQPELMDAPSVDRVFFVAPGIGFIRVTSFDVGTGKLIGQSIEKLGGAQLKGLVLDLRGNPGGVAAAALETASLFLSPGQRILSVKGRAAKSEDVDVPKTATAYRFPVVVLMNDKSASASEIVAGALQDHDRATILGAPSFGKGLVQSVYPLSGNAGLALTTAFYYTPSGRSIQRTLRQGQLGEQLAVEAPERQQEYKTDSGRKVKGGGGIQPDEEIGPPPDNRFRAVIDASAILTAFATDYVAAHKIDEQFTITAALMDELKSYLSQRKIQPDLGEWLREREWIESRLLQEIMNLGLGVEKGDEVEMRSDPTVRRALEIIRQ